MGCVYVPEGSGYARYRSHYYAPPPGVPVVVEPSFVGRPMAVLPRGAVEVVIGGQRCWHHHGRYYRRHPHGFIAFVP
ncbi:MAG: hypothetical protein RLZZ142_127 [Verrucomicrobiota bacterium]|jgi:hypothetical protein